MLRITNCNINRYRSILSMAIDISSDLNLVALCGQNNVGKTNTLRAINLFFNPETYTPEVDMPKIKHATGGQSIHPKIEITFWDDKKDIFYVICRDMKFYSASSSEESISGVLNLKEKRKKIRKNLFLQKLVIY